jgi:hypothetical protein
MVDIESVESCGVKLTYEYHPNGDAVVTALSEGEARLPVSLLRDIWPLKVPKDFQSRFVGLAPECWVPA